MQAIKIKHLMSWDKVIASRKVVDLLYISYNKFFLILELTLKLWNDQSQKVR
jgi:hypothetical protein